MMHCGWEGNGRSNVTLALLHRLKYLSTCRLGGLRKGDEKPPTVV